jgi:hypothetical protein
LQVTGQKGYGNQSRGRGGIGRRKGLKIPCGASKPLKALDSPAKHFQAGTIESDGIRRNLQNACDGGRE